MVDNVAVIRYLATYMANQTTKEKVRDLLDKGLTVLEVARHLNISPQAVYKHLHQLGEKLPTERSAS